MVALAPVFVRVVRPAQVYLAPETLHLLPKGGPELEALGNLERAGLQGDLQRRDEVPLSCLYSLWSVELVMTEQAYSPDYLVGDHRRARPLLVSFNLFAPE